MQSVDFDINIKKYVKKVRNFLKEIASWYKIYCYRKPSGKQTVQVNYDAYSL